MKLYLAIPSCRDWKPHFGASLIGLVHQMTKDGIDFFPNVMMQTSVLPKARQMAMEHAIKEGFTHILFLDDDMQFGPDLFNLLNQDKDVVAVNYSNKSPQRNPQTHRLDGQPCTSVDKLGLEEVGWIGFGAVLIRLEAIKDIPLPWFQMVWVEETKQFMGEDYFFSARVRSHGVKLYVTHDADVGHVGDVIYKEAA